MKANDYIKSIMKTVLSHRYKEGIKRELLDCIEDLTEMYMEQGMTKEEAEEEAIRQMGDPYEAAEMFNEVYQPRFEWRVAAYMVLWILFAMLIKWGLDYNSDATSSEIVICSLSGAIFITFSIILSYIEKSEDLPFLWLKTAPTKHWAMPGLGVFTNSGSIAGIGIGLLAKNISQAIILYGIVTIIMILQRLFIEMEQTKVEQEYLYKDCVAVRGFDFEGPVYIGTEKHKVRIVRGQKAKKGDYLIIIGMKGFTFVVDKL